MQESRCDPSQSHTGLKLNYLKSPSADGDQSMVILRGFTRSDLGNASVRIP